MPWTRDDVFVPFQTVIAALVTVVVVGLFVVVADELEALVVERLDGTEPLVRDAGAVGKYLLIFLVLVASYGPLSDLARPFLAPGETAWTFDLGYVLVSLLPLGIAAYVVAGSLDELAGLLVGAFRTAGERIESGRLAESGRDGGDAEGTVADDVTGDWAETESSGRSGDQSDVDGGETEPVPSSGDGVTAATSAGDDPAEPGAEE